MHKLDIAVLSIIILMVVIVISMKLVSSLTVNNTTQRDDAMDNVIKKLLSDNTEEHFTVAMANDINHYDTVANDAKKEADSWDDKKIKSISDDKKYLTADDFGWESGFQSKSCSNSSISEKFKSGPKKLLPNDLSCSVPNKLTAENYYKTHYLAQVLPLEDYSVRGANYIDYTNYAHPVKSNIRILSQNTKGLSPEDTDRHNIPTPANYAFHGTPSMRMP